MKYDHFTMLPEKAFQPRNGRQGMTLEGGGGGPSKTTVEQSNIPKWLRPQVESLLGAGMQEYFETELDPETGQYNITGVRPYKPFSEDPRDYFAPINEQQRNVYGEAAGMTTSPLFGEAAGMTREAGGAAMGSAADAMRFGQMGADYGGMAAGLAPEAQRYGSRAAEIGEMGLNAERYGRDVGEEARGFARQAADAGQRYEQMATDPSSMQAYMSPYMQNVMERQKLSAIEDAKRTNLGANLASARQGTYGGARQALAQSQREAALGKQLGDIEAQGLQSAFERAQQAQQFGSTTGLQGLQGAQAGLGTALQGGQLGLEGIGRAISGQQAGMTGVGQAGQLYGQGIQGAGMGMEGVRGAQAGYGMSGAMGAQLGNIGTAEQDAVLRRLGFQGEMGGQQRQFDQDIINQAIQNFALGEEMPFQRLAGFNALLRGYATPTTTTTQYQAQNPMNQLAGTAAQIGGVAQGVGMGKKAGGQIKAFAQGGIANESDSITDVDAIARMAEGLSIKQLQQSMRNKTVPEYIGMPILQNEINNAERMKAAQAQQMAQAQGGQQQPPIGQELMAKADALQGQGIDTVLTGAGGGIVAFSNGGLSSTFDGFDFDMGDGGRPDLSKFTDEEKLQYLQGRVGYPQIAALREGKVSLDNLFESVYEAPPAPVRTPTPTPTPTPAPAARPASQPAPMAGPAAQAGPAGIAPEAAPLTIAEMLKQREAEERAFVGEDPRIKKMQDMLKKQGEEPFLDRASRALQMIAAGEQLRTKGDTAGLKESMATEAARRKAMAEREEKLTQLEGADYERRSGIFKEVAGERREEAKTKADRAFQEKLVRLRASLTPRDFNNRILDMARGKEGTKEDQELAKRYLEGKTKSGAMTREDAVKLALQSNPTLSMAGKEEELEAMVQRILGTVSTGGYTPTAQQQSILDKYNK